ncbi:MAG TPA: alkaline phosphatase family protein [Candidatus Angelobacter sp.]|nr:alkaline phosphatase family protein [Candidatus Angelobacter sp.]
MKPALIKLVFSLLVFAAAGCGSGSLSNSGMGAGGAIPTADHVFLVVLENHSFSQVIGSSAMPYLNSLASQNSLAANYFANTHPSLGNYFVLTTGLEETNPIEGDSFPGPVSDDNIVRALAGAGKTWKAYMESIPSAGYIGGDVPPYLKHHNPFAYFIDVAGSDGQHATAQAANIVPFTQLATDMAANALPNFGFIAPNVDNDAHDCPTGGSLCPDSAKLSAADNWLKNNIDPLIKSPAFANSVLIITFDEGDLTDLGNGGGQVATVLMGSHVKTAFRSSTLFQHQSTLRLILDLLQVNDKPGAAASAASMSEFFQ